MKSVLLVLVSSPYGSDRCYHGLRLAAALRAEGADVVVFLMADATGASLEGASSASEDLNLAKRLSNLIASGVTVEACGLCLETRGYHHETLVTGVRTSSMPELAKRILGSDRVLEF